MSKSYPIVIIGAGPAGLTAAYELVSQDERMKINELQSDLRQSPITVVFMKTVIPRNS